MRYSLFDLHQAYKHTYYTCTLQFKYFTFLCLAIAQNQHGIASIVCFSIIHSSFVLAEKAPTVLGKITPLFHRTSLFLDRLSKGELFVLKETSLLVNYTSKKIYFETINRLDSSFLMSRSAVQTALNTMFFTCNRLFL